MNVVFVGDKPGKKNKDPRVPFVGTNSYKRLLEWILELEIDISNVVLCNSKDFIVECPGHFLVHKFDCDTCLSDGDKIIALGNNASKHLKSLGCEHFLMDHPSGLNRKLNDKKYVESMLKTCKDYIHNVSGHFYIVQI